MASSNSGEVNFKLIEIWKARNRLRKYIRQTPLLFSQGLSEKCNSEVYLKLESWQLTGCFKVRGAINMISSLSENERRRGLVTCSSGNHGMALSYAASIFGNPPTKIFTPKNADPNKVKKIEAFGAEAVKVGEDFLETLENAQKYAEKNNNIYVHSHSHPLIIAGQGTIGLEILDEMPAIDTVLVPIGGGGLASGIASVIKAVAPKVRIVGVEPTAAPGAFLSFRDDHCHEKIDIEPSIADGLLGTLTPLTWDILRDLLDEVILVEEEDIIRAMKVLLLEEQLIVEGAAAAGLAAILEGSINSNNEKVAVIVTGRNISGEKYRKILTDDLKTNNT